MNSFEKFKVSVNGTITGIFSINSFDLAGNLFTILCKKSANCGVKAFLICRHLLRYNKESNYRLYVETYNLVKTHPIYQFNEVATNIVNGIDLLNYNIVIGNCIFILKKSFTIDKFIEIGNNSKIQYLEDDLSDSNLDIEIEETDEEFIEENGETDGEIDETIE